MYLTTPSPVYQRMFGRTGCFYCVGDYVQGDVNFEPMVFNPKVEKTEKKKCFRCVFSISVL